jgi:hypothetical protein
MNANVVQVLPDGHLALPEQMKRAFADVKTFWAESRDEFIVLMPLERAGEEPLSASEALEEMRQMVARAGGVKKTPQEVIGDLRAIRKRIWETEYRPRYAEVLEEYYARCPDRRPR